MNMSVFNRDDLFWQLNRASPMIYPVIFGFMYLQNPSFINIFLFISYFGNLIINGFLKHIMKLTYNTFNCKNIPILGIGDRPNGAVNCGSFFPMNPKNAISFGMPSGHSQAGWFVSTFLILLFLDKNNIKNFNDIRKLKGKKLIYAISFISIFVILAFVISFSRVYVEYCHTLQQVIFGGLIGIISAFISFKIYIRLI